MIGKFSSHHLSHESQAMDVSTSESSSTTTDPLRILQPSSSKQTTAYKRYINHYFATNNTVILP